MITRINILMPLVLGGMASLGFLAGWLLAPLKQHGHPLAVREVRNQSSFTYINPLLECEMAEGMLDAENRSFDEALEEFVDTEKRNKGLSEMAVYYRDLNNGPAFGTNQGAEFLPASLLKVPVMMAYYHLAEEDPALLSERLRFEQPIDFGYTPTIRPREELAVGGEYPVGELIRRMIAYSDNQALYLLSGRLPQSEVQELFAMLGVGEDVISADPDAKLTVKEYATFFRILFNSSFLSHEYSEKALDLLAHIDYQDGLPARLPRDIMIAHKFGESGTLGAERQLHDCGIVYFPGHPYLACVMTRGQDPAALREAIQDTSRFIYDQVDAQH